jgi:hypothetical protein
MHTVGQVVQLSYCLHIQIDVSHNGTGVCPANKMRDDEKRLMNEIPTTSSDDDVRVPVHDDGRSIDRASNGDHASTNDVRFADQSDGDHASLANEERGIDSSIDRETAAEDEGGA